MAHARLSPSAAKRWLTCPGSVEACEAAGDSSSVYADEGTAGHEVFKRAVESGKNPRHWIGFKFAGIEVTAELADFVAEAWDWVQEYLAAHPGSAVYCERPVEVGPVFGLSEGLMWGTADLFILNPVELVTFDLKMGFVNVEVLSNVQVLLYTAGFLREFEFLGIEKVRHVIFQPKTEGAKVDELFVEEIEAQCSGLRQRVHDALKPNMPRRSSEEACRWCSAAATCPELHNRATELAKQDFKADEAMRAFDTQKLVDVLNHADVIRNFLNAVEAYATRLVQAGQTVPGYKLVKGKRNRVWTSKEAAIEMLAKLGFNPDEIAPRQVLSPSKAETLVGKKNKVILQPLIDKPEGEPKLVSESDPRKSLAPDFEVLDDEPTK